MAATRMIAPSSSNSAIARVNSCSGKSSASDSSALIARIRRTDARTTTVRNGRRERLRVLIAARTVRITSTRISASSTSPNRAAIARGAPCRRFCGTVYTA